MKITAKILPVMLFLFITSCITGSAAAQTSTQEKFKLSFSERIRIETFDNSVTLSRDAKAGNSYLRARTSLMGQWFPSESFEVAVKITNEFRNYFAPTTNTFHMNEVFIDQLYIKLNTKPVADGILTLGRQNITLGEGFVVMDGSPLDGSRSTYFNAARFDWNISENHLLTFMGLYQNKDDQLPVLNGNDIDASFTKNGTWRLIEQSETGGGLYYAGKMTDINIQAYYLRKDYIDPDRNAGQPKSGFNTLGSRANVTLSKNFSSAIEAAYQVGKSGGYDKNAYGGYAYIDYLPMFDQSLLPKSFTIGAVYLSGDDPGTVDDEGWDPIFSRWPKWSESFIYTQVKEFGGPAYWSNIISLYATLKFKLGEQTSFVFDCHHMLAPQEGINAGIIGTGDVRGDLMIAKLYYDISKSMSGHIIFEHFIPGDYYFTGASVSNWARIEFLYKM
jgi:hypothetical protein